MIALPNMTVPTQFQAPPPMPPSVQGTGSFSDHFANAATQNFNTPNTLNGSTALGTSLSLRKTFAKNGNTNDNSSTAQSQSINPRHPPRQMRRPGRPRVKPARRVLVIIRVPAGRSQRTRHKDNWPFRSAMA